MNTSGMRAIHPGEILEKEFLRPLGSSMADLPYRLCMLEAEVIELVAQTRDISPEVARKLHAPEHHARIQADFAVDYDLRHAEIRRG